MPDALTTDLFSRALLRGEFTLRSGATSDRYFDKYRVTCDPELLEPVAARLADLARSFAPGATRIVAPELGAVPLATAMSLELGIPMVIVRGASKGYGTSNRLEGIVGPGEGILVEDVVTSGGAALEALDVARQAGLTVRTALCVLNRGSAGTIALGEEGVALHSLLDAGDLDAAFDAGLGMEVTG